MKKENIKTIADFWNKHYGDMTDTAAKEKELQAQVDEDSQQEFEEEKQLRDKKQNYAIHLMGVHIRVETYYTSFWATQIFDPTKYDYIDILYHLQDRGYQIITRRL